MPSNAQVGAMSTNDHDPAKKPDVSKPGEPPPGPTPTTHPDSTPGGQKPSGEPGQTTGNP
jgi:hypothetical protein